MYFYKKVHYTDSKFVLCRYDFNEPEFDPIVMPEFEISKETTDNNFQKNFSIVFATDINDHNSGVLFKSSNTLIDEDETTFLQNQVI